MFEIEFPFAAKAGEGGSASSPRRRGLPFFNLATTMMNAMEKGAAADGVAHDTLLNLLPWPGRRKQLEVLYIFPSAAVQRTIAFICDW